MDEFLHVAFSDINEQLSVSTALSKVISSDIIYIKVVIPAESV